MRPILRPGSHVLRRDHHQLQIGLDPQQAVVLPDADEVRQCLSLMSRSAQATEYAGAQTLDLLAANDLVLDSSRLMPLIPSYSSDQPAVSRNDVAALARSAGDQTAAMLTARSACRVSAVPFGNGLSHGLADDLRGLLTGVGVRTAAPSHHPAGVVALVGVGEPDRELVDGWMRAGTPHLIVRLTEGAATVGPFVAPGQTACLRCLDAHHTDADPSWPLLVAQYSSVTRRDRADGVPEPVDNLIATVALAWAARDLTSFAEGRTPSTWSTTVRFDPHLTSLRTQAWQRHPACGCAWA